jgi:hypothetical protein
VFSNLVGSQKLKIEKTEKKRVSRARPVNHGSKQKSMRKSIKTRPAKKTKADRR